MELWMAISGIWCIFAWLAYKAGQLTTEDREIRHREAVRQRKWEIINSECDKLPDDIKQQLFDLSEENHR